MAKHLAGSSKIIFIGLIHLMTIVPLAKAQINQSWLSSYNGMGDFTDRFTCMSSDQQGNIIVAGSTVINGNNRDLLVNKYDSNSNLIWSVTYNAPGNGPDEATDIALDASNNIYISGFGKSDSTGSDFLIIKINSTGNLQWGKLYDSPSHQYDQANSIAVDVFGNVIVTGECDRDPGIVDNDDLVTVKFDSGGNLVWANEFNGLGDDTDRGEKVVTDALGNVYVTGRAYNGHDDDIVLIKYTGSGIQSWIQYGDRGGTDRAVDLKIDSGSFLYLTGRSDNGSNDDYLLMKYDNAGILLWSSVYDFVDDDRPIACSLDALGNVYITGESDQNSSAQRNWDISTVKFSNAGIFQWAQTFNGAVSNDDVPTAMFVSPSGEISVCGYSDGDANTSINNNIVVLNYSTNGALNWSDVYSGLGLKDDAANDVLLTSSGNCFVSGYVQNSLAQFDAVLIKYTSTGLLSSTTIYSGDGDNNESVRQIALTPANEVYLVGYTIGKLSGRDFLTIKLSSVGDTLWTRVIDGSAAASEDEANDVVVDAAGNAIVSGWLVNSGTSSDIFVVKYNQTGDTLWTFRYNGTANESDKSYDLETDLSGNVFLTGRSDIDQSVNSNDDCITIKLNSSGVLLWVKTYSSANGGNDRGLFVESTNNGDVYVAGRSSNGTDDDILILKYDAAGTALFQGVYNSNRGDDSPDAVAIDANGSFYITGDIPGANDLKSDVVLLKYKLTSVADWIQIYNGVADEEDLPEALIVDQSGNIILAGSTDMDASAIENKDFLILKYSPSGTNLWTYTIDHGQQLNDVTDDIVADLHGSYLLLGHSNVNNTDINDNIVVQRLDDSGNVSWSTELNGSADTSDAGRKLLMSGDDLFVSGGLWNTNTQRDVFVAKYSGLTSGVSESENPTIILYPNPTNGFYSVISAVSEKFELQLKDLTGRELYRDFILTNNSFPTLNYPAGTYFVTVTSEQGIKTTTKLIIQ